MNPYEEYKKFLMHKNKDELEIAVRDSYSMRIHLLYAQCEISQEHITLMIDRFKHCYELYPIIKLFLDNSRKFNEMAEVEIFRAVGECLKYPFFNMAAVYSIYSEFEFRLNKITARNIFSELDVHFSNAIKMQKKIKRIRSFENFKENISYEEENPLSLPEEELKERIDNIFKYYEHMFFLEENFYFLWSKYNGEAIYFGLKYNENNFLLLYLNKDIGQVNRQIENTKNILYRHNLIIVYLKILLDDSYNLFVKKSLYFIEKYKEERPIEIIKILASTEFRYTGRFYTTLQIFKKQVYIEIIEYIRIFDPKLSSHLYIIYNLKERTEREYTIEYFSNRNFIGNFISEINNLPGNKITDEISNKISPKILLAIFKKL